MYRGGSLVLATQDGRGKARGGCLAVRSGDLNAIEVLIGALKLREHIDHRLEQRARVAGVLPVSAAMATASS